MGRRRPALRRPPARRRRPSRLPRRRAAGPLPSATRFASFSRKTTGAVTSSNGSKESFVLWLRHSPYAFAWHVEEDVLYEGNWTTLLRTLAPSFHDLVACTTELTPTGEWARKDIGASCAVRGRRCARPVKTRWMLLAMSWRLADAVVDGYASGEVAGHHEASVAPFCDHLEWCSRATFARECLGTWTTRGAYNAAAGDVVERGADSARDVLYHPVGATPLRSACRAAAGRQRRDERAGSTSTRCAWRRPPPPTRAGRWPCASPARRRAEQFMLDLLLRANRSGVRVDVFMALQEGGRPVVSDRRYATGTDDLQLAYARLIPHVAFREVQVPCRFAERNFRRWARFRTDLADRRSNLCALYNQLRGVARCASMIDDHERRAGVRYDAVLRIRDNTIITRGLLPPLGDEGFAERSVQVKGCYSNHGLNDKVAIVPREMMWHALRSPLQVFHAHHRGDLLDGSARFDNAEALLQYAWRDLPVKRMRTSYLVDGRYVGGRWCVVDQDKDCVTDRAA